MKRLFFVIISLIGSLTAMKRIERRIIVPQQATPQAIPQPRIDILTDRALKLFLKRHNVDIEYLWNRAYSSLSWDLQDFRRIERNLCPSFTQKIEEIEAKITCLFNRLVLSERNFARTIAALKAYVSHPQNDEHEDIARAEGAVDDHEKFSFTKILQAGELRLSVECKPDDHPLAGLGRALASYFGRCYCAIRILNGDTMGIVPLIPIVIYINRAGNLCFAAAPGLEREELLIHPELYSPWRDFHEDMGPLSRKFWAIFFLVFCAHIWRPVFWTVLKPAGPDETVCAKWLQLCNKKRPCDEVMQVPLFSKALDTQSIRARHRELAKNFHPDKNSTEAAQLEFFLLQHCRNQLLKESQAIAEKAESDKPAFSISRYWV